MIRLLCLVICFLDLFFIQSAHGELAPAVGTSFSVTPDAEKGGSGTNIFYDFSGSLGIPFGDLWYFTPAYAFGINSLGGEIETFSTILGSLRYSLSENWRVKPSFSATFSHDAVSRYRSQKANLSFIYFFSSPSSLVMYGGPSYVTDTDSNRKAGAFGGISGVFTDLWFWYLDGSVSSKISGDPRTRTSYTVTSGTGYDFTERFSMSFDISYYRGFIGVSANRRSQAAFTFVLGADYHF